MSQTKNFPTLQVASAACGIILLDGLTYADMAEVAEHALGHAVWTHELGDEQTMLRVRDAIHGVYPQLPTKEEAEKDWAAAAERALKAYGQTIDLERGTQKRPEGPMETLKRMTTDALNTTACATWFALSIAAAYWLRFDAPIWGAF